MLKDFPDDEKGDDFLNEFRQKIANQQVENLEEKRNDLKRSKSVFLGAVSGMALALAVGWFILAPRYETGENAELPIVRKPQAPIKVQPAEPGGMEILNQDKSVYDIIENKQDVKKEAEKVLPPPEEPVVEKMPVVEETSVETAVYNPQAAEVGDNDGDEEIETITIVEEKKPEKPVPAAPVEAAEYKPVAPVASTTQPVKPMIPTPPANYAEELIEQTKAARNLEKVKATPVKSEFDEDDAPVAVASKTIPVGVWQLQLMSSPNKTAVEKSWGDLTKKYGMLAKQPYEIERADLGAKGIYYRLKAGNFRERAGADALCNELKSAGGTCIVKKK